MSSLRVALPLVALVGCAGAPSPVRPPDPALAPRPAPPPPPPIAPAREEPPQAPPPPATLTAPPPVANVWDADLTGYAPPSGAFGWVRYDGLLDVYALSSAVLGCLPGKGEARVRFAVDVDAAGKRAIRLVSAEGPEAVTRCLYQKGQKETANKLGGPGVVDVVAIVR